MKQKKTCVVFAILLLIVSLAAIGLSFLPIGIHGEIGEFLSAAEFDALLGCLIYQNGKTGIVLGTAMYVGFVYVFVMTVIAFAKKRGAFILLDLLALILGFRAAMNLVYGFVVNRDATGILAFSIILGILCIVCAIFPLLCPGKQETAHPTALASMPSTIPTVDKKSSDEEENAEGDKETKAEESAAAEPAEEPAKEESAEETKEEPITEEPVKGEPVEEETKEEAAPEAPVEEKTDSTEAKEDKPADVNEEPAVIEEKPAETEKETAEAPKEEKAEEPSKSKNDGKIAKTEVKTMKEEKKATKPAAAKAAPKAAAAKAAKPAQKAQGKYEVYPEAGFFKYRLKANNGEILIVSNGYKTRDGAHKGIDTLVKAVATGVAKIVIDKNKYAQFRLYTASDSRLIVAGEYYPNAKGAQNALESVEKFYKTDKIVDLDEIPESEIREWRIALPKAEKSDKGKFEIYVDETKKFRGRLLANNGQLLFATSAYAAKTGVTGALEKVQKKFASSDVTVTCDKQGRYQFIVYADNGAVLVMGESYTSKDRAISAAKSSMNFSTSPAVVDVTKNED